MKRYIPLAAAITAAILQGCGGSSSSVEETSFDPSAGVVETPVSKVVFNPLEGAISVPNNLLFSGTTDGTLEIPDEVAGRAAGGADYSDPGVAIGALDGWSTQIPFQLSLDIVEGATIDTSTLPANIIIAETLVSDGTNCNGTPTTIPAGQPCAPTGNNLAFGVDFVATATSNSLVIVPLRPLPPSTTYVVALTDGILDSRGEALAPSDFYQLIKDTAEAPDNASLAALKNATDLYEGMTAAASGGAVNPESIVYSFAMTTQSVGNSLGTLKNLMQLAPSSVSVTNSGISVRTLITNTFGSDPGAAFDLANYYSGSITLPYYLSVPTETSPTAPLTAPWRALCDNGVLLSSGITGEAGANDLTCQALGLRDFGLDSDRHITRYNPVPETRALMDLEVQMTVPAAGCAGACPVVIVQHGITSRKEEMLPITAALSAAGLATIAIDLPLHGSRGFDLDGDDTDDINASTVDVQHFMNLQSLLVGRDNLRQSVADLLGLRLALANFTADDGTTIDTDRVYYVGLSLGGIVGTNFTAMANSDGNPAYTIQALSTHSAGGGIPQMLVESPAFGTLVQASVLAGTGSELSNEFVTFLGTPDTACQALTPGSAPYIVCQFGVFSTGLDAADQAELAASVAAFVFASQTLLDGADPNNFAGILAASGTPIHMTMVAGDGADNLADQVIPNQTVNTLLGGTAPLAALSGVTQVDGSTAGSGLVVFTKGHHASVVDPSARPEAQDTVANAMVTTEMQTQTATFFATDGTSLVITDGTHVQEAP